VSIKAKAYGKSDFLPWLVGKRQTSEVELACGIVVGLP
jgi:hypothetical protein